MSTVRFAVRGGDVVTTDESSTFSTTLSSMTGTIFSEKTSFELQGPKEPDEEARMTGRGDIYGRKREASLLREAFRRVRGVQGSDGKFLQRGGSSEIVVVHGPSGTGKTKLVEAALCNYAPDIDGCLITGKFNQFSMTGESYSALSAAFSDLCDLLTSSQSDEELAQIREDLGAKLGSEAHALTLLIPNLHYLLPHVKMDPFGTEDQAGREGGSRASTRLKQLCCAFLQTVAKAGKPVALFLDDLQWADEASMELVDALFTSATSKHILFVAAFRDEDEFAADEEMPLSTEMTTDNFTFDSFVQSINEKIEDCVSRSAPSVVNVGNLDVESINDFVAAFTGNDKNETKQLSSVVFHKTNGNPYFIQQYLELLKREELIVKGEDEYVWDLERILLETNVSDNVVELVAGKIESLSIRMQEVLKLAAFLGCRFHYTFLEALLADPLGGGPSTATTETSDEHSTSNTTDDRSFSSSLALGRRHRSELANLLSDAVAEGLLEKSSKGNFKFAHDRVQQCLVAMVQEGEERLALHLSMGRALANEWRGGTIVKDRTLRGQMLLLMTDHYNLGRELMTNEKEMVEVVRWNLDASKWSKRQTAFGSSAEYLREGVAMLNQQPGDKWVDHYELTLEIFSLLGHLEYCNGDYDASDAACEEVLDRARTLLDKLDAYSTMVRCLGSQKGKLRAAISFGLSVLRMLGEPFPKKPRLWHIVGELMRTRKALKGLSNNDLLSLSPITDKGKLATMELMWLVLFASFTEEDSRPYFALVALRLMARTCQLGTTSWTGAIFAVYGGIEAAAGFLTGARRFLDLFNALVADQSLSCHKQSECRAHLLAHGMLSQWYEPIEIGRAGSLRGYMVGMESGDFSNALYCANHYSAFAITSPMGLVELEEELRMFCRQERELNLDTLLTLSLPTWQLVLNLLGDGGDQLGVLSGEAFVLEEFQDIVESGTHKLARVIFYAQKLGLASHFDRWFIMEESFDPLVRESEEVLKGHFSNFQVTLVTGLVSSKLSNHVGRKKYRRHARMATRRFKGWVKDGVVSCNFGLSLLLAEGIVLRDSRNKKKKKKKTRKTEALEHYTTALREAQELGAWQWEAIISERMFVALSKTYNDQPGAVHSLKTTISLYERWEAFAKVDWLKMRYGNMLAGN